MIVTHCTKRFERESCLFLEFGGLSKWDIGFQPLIENLVSFWNLEAVQSGTLARKPLKSLLKCMKEHIAILGGRKNENLLNFVYFVKIDKCSKIKQCLAFVNEDVPHFQIPITGVFVHLAGKGQRLLESDLSVPIASKDWGNGRYCSGFYTRAAWEEAVLFLSLFTFTLINVFLYAYQEVQIFHAHVHT